MPIKNLALLIALGTACVALTGCGNKGPLVKPSDSPAATPADAEPAAKPAADLTTPAPAAGTASGTPAARR